MAIKIKLSKKAQQTIAAGAVIAGVVGYIFIAFFWMPISKQIADTQKQIEDMEGKIAKAQHEADRLPHLNMELVQLNQQAVEAAQRLPQKKGVPDILVAVSELADANQVLLVNFLPGTTAVKPFFNELNFPISVKGSYHNVGRFLAALSLQERIFNVSNVVYGQPAADSGEMTVNFTLISYQYKG